MRIAREFPGTLACVLEFDTPYDVSSIIALHLARYNAILILALFTGLRAAPHVQ